MLCGNTLCALLGTLCCTQWAATRQATGNSVDVETGVRFAIGLLSTRPVIETVTNLFRSKTISDIAMGEMTVLFGVGKCRLEIAIHPLTIWILSGHCS